MSISRLATLLIISAALGLSAGTLVHKTTANNDITEIPQNANMLVIPIAWNNKSFPTKNVKLIQHDMFSLKNKNSFANILNRITWGNQSAHGDILPVQKLSENLEFTEKVCDKLINTAKARVEEIKKSYSQYDEYVVLGTFPCWWAGLTSHADKTIYLTGQRVLSPVMIHEIFHAMGMSHSSSLVCNSNRLSHCGHDEYGDPYSTMGRIYDPDFLALSSYERYMLGYQNKSNLINWLPQTTKYHIYNPKINSTKPTLLQIPLDNNNYFSDNEKERINDQQISYYVEYTKPTVRRTMYFSDMARKPVVTIRIGQRIINNDLPKDIRMNSYLLNKATSLGTRRCWRNNSLSANDTIVDSDNHLIIHVDAIRKDKAVISVTKTPDNFNFPNYINNDCSSKKDF